jgi:Tol biopolymer transport system component
MGRIALVAGTVLGIVAPGCSFPDPKGDPVEACSTCVLPERANADGGAGGDASVPAVVDTPKPEAGPPKCSSAAIFANAKLLPGIDPNRHASSPHLTPDELTVFFTSVDPDVSAQIYRATRASRNDAFGAVEPAPNINSVSNDNDPTVSSDGLTLVFHSGRDGTNDVWWSKRANTTAEFGAPVVAPGIATAAGAYEGQGFFHVASDELWFVSDRGGNYDIFRAKRNGATFAEPVNVAELNTPQDDFLPFLSQDGLTMYLSSTRDGGKGGQDLYLATRADPNGAFAKPTPIAELNTDVGEQAGSISPDTCRIYFSRQGGPGGQQIFVAERPLPH